MPLRERFIAWALRVKPPEESPIVLGQGRVYVLPTRAGLAYGLTLIVLLLGAINYGLSLGYAVTFLLAGLGVMTILETFRNLLGLRLEAARNAPVFAGERAGFTLLLHNDRSSERRRLWLALAGGEPQGVDLPAQGSVAVTLHLAASQRGWLLMPRLNIETRWPLGLIRAFAYCAPEARCLIWPRPAPAGLPLPRGRGTQGSAQSFGRGDEDFAGLRTYQPADPPQHVAWKAAARLGSEAGLLTKLFAGAQAESVLLDWFDLPATWDAETRIAQLTRWVLDASAQGRPWGLRLPQRSLPLGQGEEHLARCLEALALFGH